MHEHAVVKIDADIDLQLASIVGCGVATGLGAVFNTARVPVGATVVVTGVGGVGLNAVQGARIAGASQIIAVDITPGKLEFARALGATTVVDASSTHAADAVRELTNGGADFVFETSGVPAVAESCADMVGNGGTIVLVGIPSKEATVAIRPADLIRERSPSSPRTWDRCDRPSISRGTSPWRSRGIFSWSHSSRSGSRWRRSTTALR